MIFCDKIMTGFFTFQLFSSCFDISCQFAKIFKDHVSHGIVFTQSEITHLIIFTVL